MVAELRKRKEKAPPAAAPEPAPKAKKVAKKTEKRKATEDTSPVAVKKQKAVPKKAAATTPTKPAKGAKSKASKKKAAEEEEEEAVAAQKEEAEEQEEAKGEADEVEEGDEVDEKTQALVQKLDSADEQEADEGAGKENLGTYKKGQAVGKAPKVAALVKKNPSEPVEGENRGTIYVGHVPFGFFEHQMKEYFGQFGDVTRIRLSRNKKTGASKHYGFVEFKNAEVAEIVAKTMDKYLLFGCILAVRVVPVSQIHPDLWKGANRRWKVYDRNAVEGKQLAARAGETAWNARVSKEQQRRAKRADKLKELGYDFKAPQLKAAVAPEAPAALENAEEDAAPVQAIEAAPAAEKVEEEEKKEPEADEKAEEEPAEEVEAKPATKKAKPAAAKKGAKGKKVKS